MNKAGVAEAAPGSPPFYSRFYILNARKDLEGLRRKVGRISNFSHPTSITFIKMKSISANTDAGSDG